MLEQGAQVRAWATDEIRHLLTITDRTFPHRREVWIGVFGGDARAFGEVRDPPLRLESGRHAVPLGLGQQTALSRDRREALQGVVQRLLSLLPAAQW